MKIVFRTLLFHILCIIIFAFIYLTYARDFGSLENEFNKKNTITEEKGILDFLLLSTTIQAGVGFSYFIPLTSFTKIIMMLQQILLISVHVFTIYIFTL